MSHDATKQLLGVTGSSDRVITVHDQDPANMPAGKRAVLKSDGSLSLLKSDGYPIGISLGKSLSDTKKTAVVRSGLRVPLLVSLKRATGTVTITSYANLVSGTDDALAVAGVSFVAQAGAATPGQATFQAATSNDATATSLAAQINAHATSGALVRAYATGAAVLIYAITGGAAGNDIAVAYTDNDTNVGLTLSGLSGGKLSGGSDDIADVVATIGSKVYIDDVLGIACENQGGSTVSDAVYDSAVLNGVDSDGSAIGPCILVNMPGGL